MPKTTFRYDRDSILTEFKDAKAKDIKLGGGDDNAVHKNRIKFLQEMIALEKESPEVFEDVDIKFQALLDTYLAPNPREAFYQKVFGRSYEAVTSESAPVRMSDYS